jgi:hypothetical protein
VEHPLRQIRADYDHDTIVVYQAYNDAIADAAVEHGRFAGPFSRGRMTWIKPSYLWLMERSGWATKPNQERILAVRITRTGWEEALGLAESSSAEMGPPPPCDVRVQWDPERDHRGTKLGHRSIQVGIGRRMVDRCVDEWVVAIEDRTPVTRRIRRHLADGRTADARRLLPPEREYVLSSAETARRLGITPR